jgi:hypothetical protein
VSKHTQIVLFEKKLRQTPEKNVVSPENRVELDQPEATHHDAGAWAFSHMKVTLFLRSDV